MAKKSSVEKNKRRIKLVAKFAAKRERLKTTANDNSLSLEERFGARLKLAELPRNGGRPRAYYRKLKMSRIALRELGGLGLVPGLVKSSW
jgi:small subunit ribosomal protein S14